MPFLDDFNKKLRGLGATALGFSNPITAGPTAIYALGKGIRDFFNSNKTSSPSQPTTSPQQNLSNIRTAAIMNKPNSKVNSSAGGGFGGGGAGSWGDTSSPSAPKLPTSNFNFSSPSYSGSSFTTSNYNSSPVPPGSVNDGKGNWTMPSLPSSDQSSIQTSQPNTPQFNPYNEQLTTLQNKLNGLNDGLLNYLKPTQEETDAQAQLDAIQGKLKGITASRDLGIADVKNQPIAMNFITGQAKNLIDQAEAKAGALGAEAEPLTTKLARLQAARQQGFDAAKFQIGNAQNELEQLQKQSSPIEVGGNLVRLNSATGQYETIFKSPSKDTEGFTLGEGQMRFDAKGNLIASGAPKTAAEQLTNDIKEYNFARSQGYQGSFTDYKNSQAGGGSNLPAAYREYQLSQNDPGFAQYLNKGLDGLNQQQLNAIQNSPEGKQLLAIQNLQNKLNAYRQEAARPGGFESVGSRKAILDSLYADLKIAYKDAAGLGALTGPDVAIITEAIKPISGITNYPGYLASGGQKGVLNSIDQALATINKQAETNYRSLTSKYPNFQNNSYIQNLNPEVQQLRSMGYSDDQIQQLQRISSQQRGFNSDLSRSQNGSNIGALSSKYESSGRPDAISWDNTGGWSFGKYQMAHNTPLDFVQKSQFRNYFNGVPMDTSSKAFQNAWKKAAQDHPQEFAQEQENYMLGTHYSPQVNKLQSAGFNLDNRSNTLKQVVFSTSIQHGPNNNVILNAIRKVGANAPDDVLIPEIYRQRWSGGANFARSTPDIQRGVYNRFFNPNSGEMVTAMRNLQQEYSNLS